MESKKSFSGGPKRADLDARRWYATYLGAQAVLVALWWALIWRFPEVIQLFRSDAVPDAALLDLWLADGLLVFGGSALGSFLVVRNHRAAEAVLWILCGALAYATLTSLGGFLRSGGGSLAVVLMGPATFFTFQCAIRVRA